MNKFKKLSVSVFVATTMAVGAVGAPTAAMAQTSSQMGGVAYGAAMVGQPKYDSPAFIVKILRKVAISQLKNKGSLFWKAFKAYNKSLAAKMEPQAAALAEAMTWVDHFAMAPLVFALMKVPGMTATGANAIARVLVWVLGV